MRCEIGVGMTYESPIKIYEKITREYEDNVINVIVSYGITVDKEELLKALAYDRGQYEKGYNDAKVERIAKVEQQYHMPDLWKLRGDCGVCGTTVWKDEKYCHKCGAKLDWEER